MDVATLEAGVPWDFSTFPEYLASVERRGVGLNFAAYVGHMALRLFVMGDDAYERAATPEEIAALPPSRPASRWASRTCTTCSRR